MTFNQFTKDRLKDDKDWEPTYIKQVKPSWKKMRKMFNLFAPKKRGRGYTRPFKDTSKKARKQEQASRRINRR